LPFSIGKGSRAALEGAAREHKGSTGEHSAPTRQCRGSAKRSLNWLMLFIATSVIAVD